MLSNRTRSNGAELDRRLERLLRTDAANAPLPADLLRVPGAWVRGHRRTPTSQIGRVLAVGGVIAAAVIVAIALPRAWQLGTNFVAGPLTAERAAALAGVPGDQVVATRDGFVAIRVLAQAPKTTVQILRVADAQPEPTVSLLTQVPVGITDIQPDSNLLWVEALSCSPDRGLRQPNMLFGYTQPEPSRVSLNVSARGTESGGYFLYVLDDAELNPDQWIVISLGSAEDRRSASLFALTDPCTGEPPVGH